MADPFDPKEFVIFKEMLVAHYAVITEPISGGKAYSDQAALGVAIDRET